MRRASGWASSWNTGSTPRFDGAAAKQLRAEGVDGADEGAVERAGGACEQGAHGGIELGGAAAFEALAHAQLHIAGGGVGEGDGDDGIDGGSGGDGIDDAVHEGGGFSGARGGLDDGGAGEGAGGRGPGVKAMSGAP